jgi:peptidylprolyl isomerase
MLRNKYFWMITVLILIGAGVGGFLYWHNKNNNSGTGLTLLNNSDNSSSGSGSAGVGLSPSSSVLSVSGGSPTNLGQLGAGNNSSQSGGGSSGGNSKSGGSQSPSPDTFAQYDKYKDAQNSLFGDIAKGDGAELTANKTAVVTYKGWLTNGKMFDASRQNSDGSLQPFVFTLGAKQVIPGFEQGVAGMKVGGSRLVIVPPAVGYGSEAKDSIPPNSLLVFEIKLLSVQ